MSELSDQELLDALGVSAEPEKKRARSPREERIIAGFEEIQNFVDEHGRVPQSGEGGEIFERLYAVRLEQIRKQQECRDAVMAIDRQGLLSGDVEPQADSAAELDDEALLAELGAGAVASEITELKHVRSSAEKRAAEEIANRDRCEDYDTFKPLFEKVQEDLETGVRQTRPFELKSEIRTGRFFVVGGQKAYVADMGEIYSNAQGRTDARLRVIFDNGTESNMLMRSLQRQLHADDAGRRISDPSAGPLFKDHVDDEDQASGIIYVLRSKSDDPQIVQHYNVLHKIGVTSGKVERRITNAKNDPTFLLAEVEVVAQFELFNINRTKLESLIHKILEPARLNIEIKDRFGRPVTPREWFLVPFPVIEEIVDRIKDGSITNYVYDTSNAILRKIELG